VKASPAIVALNAFVLAGCFVSLPDYRGRACDGTHPCVDGWQCVAGFCTLDGGTTDGGCGFTTPCTPACCPFESVCWIDGGCVPVQCVDGGVDGQLLNGPEWVQGKVHQALRFDGVSTEVKVPNHPSTWSGSYSQYSLAFWIKVDAVKDNAGAITVGPMANPTLQMISRTSGSDGGTWGGRFATTGAGCTFDRTAALPYLTVADGAWHHVVLTLDALSDGVGPLCNCYSDGVLVATVPNVNGTTAFGTSDLFFGGFDPSVQVSGLACVLDEVRIYDRALSQGDVTNLLNLVPVNDHLLDYYPMDEGTGTITHDACRHP
jgi:hypothetical protein